MKRFIKIISYENGKCVEKIDVSDQTERQIEKIERGLNINLNHDKFYTIVE